MSLPPAPQMSLAASADIELKIPPPVRSATHLLPFQRIVSLPGMKLEIQTSLLATASTDNNVLVPAPGFTVVQLAPVKWRRLVFSPVTHTSRGPVPETDSIVPPKPCLENELPFQCWT